MILMKIKEIIYTDKQIKPMNDAIYKS